MTVFAGIVIACFVVVSYYWSLWQGGEAVFISAAEAVPVPSLSLPDPQIMQQADTGSFPAGKQHCLACHEGIEPGTPFTVGHDAGNPGKRRFDGRPERLRGLPWRKPGRND